MLNAIIMIIVKLSLIILIVNIKGNYGKGP